MRARTQTITIAADVKAVFAFVSRPENLPEWAFGFARSVRADGDHWIAVTDSGETRFTLMTDESHGIVDFFGASSGQTFVLAAPTRVVGIGPNQSAYLFTLFQRPKESYESFERRLKIVNAELVALRTALESQRFVR